MKKLILIFMLFPPLAVADASSPDLLGLCLATDPGGDSWGEKLGNRANIDLMCIGTQANLCSFGESPDACFAEMTLFVEQLYLSRRDEFPDTSMLTGFSRGRFERTLEQLDSVEKIFPECNDSAAVCEFMEASSRLIRIQGALMDAQKRVGDFYVDQ